MLKRGVVIVAIGATSQGESLSPLTTIGSISIARRLVLTYQQAGTELIVFVTGHEALELEQHLSDFGVIFLKQGEKAGVDKFKSACVGFNFLKDKCEHIFFTSVAYPLYTAKTLQQMLDMQQKMVLPYYNGEQGHPLLLERALLPEILAYTGPDGMRGAISALEEPACRLDTEDEGVVLSVSEIEKRPEVILAHNRNLLHPFLRVNIEKEKLFFNARAKLMLQLVRETQSMKQACKHMALSYAKAWDMLNEMETELGYPVVERRQGGRRGGTTQLTEKGAQFLQRYEQYEQDIKQYAVEHFHELFIDA